MDILFPYSESKLKPFLKMASQRIRISNNKRSTASTKHKREIAKLLEDGKAEKAIIRVEHVIRDDYTTEAYEIIELMCDLLHERVKYLTKNEMCPPDLAEAVSTVIWATSRVDIEELEGVKKQLGKKYGKEFCDLCELNSRNTVNARVVHKLNVAPPGNLLIRSYLQEIAKEYNVEWDDETFPIKEDGSYKDGTQMGYSIPMAGASGLSSVYVDNTQHQVPTPLNMSTTFESPPGYEDAQRHTTTEVGCLNCNQGQMMGNVGNQQLSQNPPSYEEVNQPSFQSSVPQNQPQEMISPSSFSPPTLPTQQQQQPPPPPPPPQQEQQQQQPTNSSPNITDASSGAPSYDDLMARFKNLKN